jgi:ubiquinone/menaquinone biosynthesis C-methylase UbiE
MPLADSGFDLAYSQHVQMNVADKAVFYREIARVLRPGGRFVLHDILAGPAGPPHFPVHWAEDASMSFLIAPGRPA